MKQVILLYPRPWPGKTMSGRVPFSLLNLASYMKDTEYDVKILDERIEPSIAASINAIEGNVICFGISSFTGVQIKNGIAIAKIVRARFPYVPIVWGGWHVSSLPDQSIEHDVVDIIVRGPGEVTFKELVETLDKGGDLSCIEGINYKKNGTVYNNPDRKLTRILENLKMDFDVIDVNKYVYEKPFAEKSSRTLGIITSLGCPNDCGFCAVAGQYKRRILFRNVKIVMEELDYLVETCKITGITIDDDNFFVNQKKVREFCEALIKKPYKLGWDAGVSVDLLIRTYSDETLNLIKDSGCQQLYIGAESGSDDVLKYINKKATVEQTYQFVRKMKEFGIKASFSTMVGLPNVPENEFFMTMDMILKCREINPDFDFRLFYYTPYPSTTLYHEALKAGMKEPTSLEGWSQHTLRKFKAPWVKRSYRKMVVYFYFYYYPYSGEMVNRYMHGRFLNRVVEFLMSLVFANIILRAIAKLRVKYRFFKFPIDAMFVIQGSRLRSLYGRLVHKNIDIFHEFNS